MLIVLLKVHQYYTQWPHIIKWYSIAALHCHDMTYFIDLDWRSCYSYSIFSNTTSFPIITWFLGQRFDPIVVNTTTNLGNEPTNVLRNIRLPWIPVVLIGWRKETINEQKLFFFSPTMRRGESQSMRGWTYFVYFSTFFVQSKPIMSTENKIPSEDILAQKVWIIAKIWMQCWVANVTFSNCHSGIVPSPILLWKLVSVWAQVSLLLLYCSRVCIDIGERLIWIANIVIFCIRAYLAHCYCHWLGFWCCLCWCSSKKVIEFDTSWSIDHAFYLLAYFPPFQHSRCQVWEGKAYCLREHYIHFYKIIHLLEENHDNAGDYQIEYIWQEIE